MPTVSEAEFYAAVDRFFSRMLEEIPVAATQFGDHRYDHHAASWPVLGLLEQQPEPVSCGTMNRFWRKALPRREQVPEQALQPLFPAD